MRMIIAIFLLAAGTAGASFYADTVLTEGQVTADQTYPATLRAQSRAITDF